MIDSFISYGQMHCWLISIFIWITGRISKIATETIAVLTTLFSIIFVRLVVCIDFLCTFFKNSRRERFSSKNITAGLIGFRSKLLLFWLKPRVKLLFAFCWPFAFDLLSYFRGWNSNFNRHQWALWTVTAKLLTRTESEISFKTLNRTLNHSIY